MHGCAGRGEDRAATHQVGVLLLVDDADVVELDVQVLVHRVQRALDRQVVLKLDGHLPQHSMLPTARLTLRQHTARRRVAGSVTETERRRPLIACNRDRVSERVIAVGAVCESPVHGRTGPC